MLPCCCSARRVLDRNPRSGGGLHRVQSGRERGNPCACEIVTAGLGSLVVAGLGTKRDLERGEALLEQGCAGGDGFACESLGGIYAGGELRSPDPRRAAAYYDRACELGRPAPCAFLATFLEHGDAGLAPDPARVVRLLERACAGDVEIACSMLETRRRDRGTPDAGIAQ